MQLRHHNPIKSTCGLSFEALREALSGKPDTVAKLAQHMLLCADRRLGDICTIYTLIQ